MKITNLYDANDTIEVAHAEELANQDVVAYYTTKNCYCPLCMSFGELHSVTGFERQDGQYFKCENCGKTNS